MPSDFSNLQDAGRQCVGCGRGADAVILMRLRTYARSLCCGACFINPEYAKCANENHEGKKCGHDPHPKGPCKQCQCPDWRHGLESDMDRQFAACVGLEPTSRECTGYGSVECHRIVFANANGEIPRLCESCMRGWMNDTKEGAKQVAALLDIDPSKVELPT